MINYDIDKDLHIFPSFPDQSFPLTLKSNLRIVLGSNPENFKNIEARKNLLSLQKKCVLLETYTQFFNEKHSSQPSTKSLLFFGHILALNFS